MNARGFGGSLHGLISSKKNTNLSLSLLLLVALLVLAVTPGCTLRDVFCFHALHICLNLESDHVHVRFCFDHLLFELAQVSVFLSGSYLKSEAEVPGT